MKIVSISAAIIASISIACGCGGPARHAWQTDGNDNCFSITTSSWEIIKGKYWARVDKSHWEPAVSQLADKHFIQLSAEKAAEYCPAALSPQEINLLPFLVRGVAYGGCPAYTIIKFDKATKQLLVHQATYNGENLFVEWSVNEPIAAPIMVYLPCPPSEVYATAVLGGDWVLISREISPENTK